MNRGLSWISGIGIGAGLMYLLDPERGRRRRTLLRDRMVRAVNRAGNFLDATARDVSHRAQGLAAEARSLPTSEEVLDEVLVERVRSRLGRIVSHPHSIRVTARGGRVTLSGPVLQSEVDGLIACISSVRGMTGIENRLEVHQQAGGVSGLQGVGRREGRRVGLLQGNWSPSTRLLAGMVGCGLMANCLARRTPPAALLGTAGFALFVRGLTNQEIGRLLQRGVGRRAGRAVRRGSEERQGQRLGASQVPVGEGQGQRTGQADGERRADSRTQGQMPSSPVLEPGGVGI